MFGISMPLYRLYDGEGPSRRPFEELAPLLHASHISSIELRTVTAHDDPKKVRAAADLVRRCGFRFTVHGSVRSAETAVADVLAPLEDLWEGLEQREIIVTVHPIDGDNVAMLTALTDEIRARKLPCRIALENNRLLPDKQEGDSMALVLSAVETLGRREAGICFDMGHYCYYCLKHREDGQIPVPEYRFLRRVIHTHIHGVDGLTTHFPLVGFRIPIEEFVSAMADRYTGLYNMELDYPRFDGRITPEDAITSSAERLYNAMTPSAMVKQEQRDHFVDQLRHAASVFTSPGNAFSMFHSTSYLFRTGGVCWAVDPALRCAADTSDATLYLHDLLRPAKFVLITHGHVDHLESTTVELLRDLPMLWVVPEFLTDEVRKMGVPAERIVTAKAGEPLTVCGVRITPFHGRHYRPGTQNGIRELGYYVEAPETAPILFPGDTRDYDPAGFPKFDRVGLVFAHVWLGDEMAMEPISEDLAQKFVRFALCFRPERVCIAHLNESGRDDRSMWRFDHGEALRDRILAAAPETEVLIPHSGDVTELR